MSELVTLLPPQPEAGLLAQALHDSARPLMALATQLRRAAPVAPEGMAQALAAAVSRFERELAAAGWDERQICAASYVLCVWVDEVVADTPWGAGGAGLLQRFHGESDGGGKILCLLSRLAERPDENRALLALFHACLSLGLTGRLRGTPDAERQLETLRSRVFLTLPNDGSALSPPWRSAVAKGPTLWRRHLAPGLLVFLGLLALGAYSASQLQLAARVDEVFASMQQLSANAGTGPPAATPAALRLTPRLAPDIDAGRLVVRDEVHRSVVSVAADALFERASTQLSSAGAALVARVGQALAPLDGKVVVVGHTDGSDGRSARLPSAWHQSYEWARVTTDALARTLPTDRLAVEGAADLQAPTDTGMPRRRVDIVLYP